MTHKEFTYWLSGFLNGKKVLSEEEVSEINKQMTLVSDWPTYTYTQFPFTNTPGINEPTIIPDHNIHFTKNFDVVGIHVPFVAGT